MHLFRTNRQGSPIRKRSRTSCRQSHSAVVRRSESALGAHHSTAHNNHHQPADQFRTPGRGSNHLNLCASAVNESFSEILCLPVEIKVLHQPCPHSTITVPHAGVSFRIYRV